jgi:outer membrane protein OmpA-like peptidoglycan-associated protein
VNEVATTGSMEGILKAFGPILFQTDLANLDDAARRSITEARGQLRAWPESVALVRAYTDTRGTDRRNAELAQQRARAVADELIRVGGVAANRVYVASLGPSDLPVITAPKIDQAENRSVQIVVVRLKGG